MANMEMFFGGLLFFSFVFFADCEKNSVLDELSEVKAAKFKKCFRLRNKTIN